MSITIADFEAICAKMAVQRTACDMASDALKRENAKLAELEKQVMESLKSIDKDSYQSESGTVYISHRMSVTVPKLPEDREAFFSYLKNVGLYESMITVNSQTLNSFYKAEFEAAKESGRGLDFAIPGIKEAKINEVIGFRKGK